MVRNIPYNQSEVIMRTKVEQLLKETELYNQKLIKQNLLEDEKLWSTSDVGQRMDFLYRRRTQKLCSGNVSYFDFKTFTFHTSCNMLPFFEIGTGFCIFTYLFHSKNMSTAVFFCTFIHHYNPFLKMGPFKFEAKHQNPEIGFFHDFVSTIEIE